MTGAGATCAVRAVRRDGYWLVRADGGGTADPALTRPAGQPGPAGRAGAAGPAVGREPDAGAGARAERALAERYLAGLEWERYRTLAGPARRDWLLGRVAVKDAVCDWLGDRGAGRLHPTEVRVWNEPSGRPGVTVPGGERLAVSIAHRAGVAVATVADAGDPDAGPAAGAGAAGVAGVADMGGAGRPVCPVVGAGADGGIEPGRPEAGGAGTAGAAGTVGIDVELIESRSATFVGLMMAEGERRLGEGRPADEWVTAAWAAKEAVAKAAGTGLQGRPKDWVVEAADGDWLLVAGNWVRTAREGDHVVAVVARRGPAPA